MADAAACSTWPSSACCTRPRCTATSCASGSTRVLGAVPGAVLRHALPLPARTWSPAAGSSRQPTAAGRRRPPAGRKVVYELTADGKEQFQDLLAEAGPAAWEDESFDVRFAFFARTDAAVRLRILEGRRSRLEERLDNVKAAAAPGRGTGWTATPWSCSGTAWTPPSARCAGSTS